MNRNAIVAAVFLIVLLVGGYLVFKSYQKTPNLETNNMTQTPNPTSALDQISQTPISGNPRATIKTAKGDIVIEMRPDLAPKTVANFLQKFNSGYCDGLNFHRVEDWVVQGCDPAGNGTGGNTSLPTETSNQPFVAGAVGVARKAMPKELSNDSQFFITKTDSTFLDGEYTYFGQVVSGMDVVNKLAVGDKIISATVLSK